MERGSDGSLGSLPCMFRQASAGILVGCQASGAVRKAVACIRPGTCACDPDRVDLSAWSRLPHSRADSLPLSQSLRPSSVAWVHAQRSHRLRLETRSNAFLPNTGRIPSRRRGHLPHNTQSSKPPFLPRHAVAATSPSTQIGAVVCTAMPWVRASSGSSAYSARKSPIAVFAATRRSLNRKHCSRRDKAGVTRQHRNHRLMSAPIFTGRDWYVRPVTFVATSALGHRLARHEPRHRP